MRYEGSNPSLCTIFFVVMSSSWLAMKMDPAGDGRLVISLVALALLAALVWRTMEPGKFQQLSWVLLAFFAVRVVITWRRAR
jgi:hypothetical protein